MNNRRAIIDLLLARGSRSRSRAAIAGRTGLSKPTVSAVTADLIATESAPQAGGLSSRQPARLPNRSWRPSNLTRAGDADAGAIVGETALYLGVAAANLVNALNPAVVILGGLTARRFGDILVTATRDAARRASAVPLRALQIVLGQAEEVAVPLGARAQVRERAGELLAAW